MVCSCTIIKLSLVWILEPRDTNEGRNHDASSIHSLCGSVDRFVM
jgi:hypothetical protein